MPHSVLVAGREDQTHLALCELLSRAGLSVLPATSISDALSGIDDRPQLLVLDMAIDNGNGVKIMQAIRTNAIKTKVAVLSSAQDTPSLDWIHRYQPDAVFGKPLDFDDFVDWLSSQSARAV